MITHHEAEGLTLSADDAVEKLNAYLDVVETSKIITRKTTMTTTSGRRIGRTGCEVIYLFIEVHVAVLLVLFLLAVAASLEYDIDCITPFSRHVHNRITPRAVVSSSRFTYSHGMEMEQIALRLLNARLFPQRLTLPLVSCPPVVDLTLSSAVTYGVAPRAPLQRPSSSSSIAAATAAAVHTNLSPQ